jgi:hypothetical protein
MQMYVHYYERELINEGDNPLIGIVLCADKSESVVKYTLPENETQIFASKCKLYLPSEEELLRELNQEYQALEAGKTDEENSGDMKLIFCGKRVARTVFVQQKYFSYFRILWGYVLIWYACRDCGIATKEKYVEILEFTHFVEFFSFKKIGENHKEKSLVKKVTVVVALDLGTGNTKNIEYENE